MSYLYNIHIVVNGPIDDYKQQEILDKELEELCCTYKNLDFAGYTICELSSKTCGKCAQCGAWVSDKSKPDHIPGFSDGCFTSFGWLCDICLPMNHPKQFRNKATD